MKSFEGTETHLLGYFKKIFYLLRVVFLNYMWISRHASSLKVKTQCGSYDARPSYSDFLWVSCCIAYLQLAPANCLIQGWIPADQAISLDLVWSPGSLQISGVTPAASGETSALDCLMPSLGEEVLSIMSQKGGKKKAQDAKSWFHDNLNIFNSFKSCQYWLNNSVCVCYPTVSTNVYKQMCVDLYCLIVAEPAVLKVLPNPLLTLIHLWIVIKFPSSPTDVPLP